MSVTATVPMTLERLPGFRPRPHARQVVFDFDGTLSLLRGGWPEVMLALFLEHLPTPAPADRPGLERLLMEDIWSLNGRPSIHQMQRLCERILERGGVPRPPSEYEADYQGRLSERTSRRLAERAQPGASISLHTVPGAHGVLEACAKRGLTLHLVSGTLESEVVREAQELGLARFFNGRIHGPASMHDLGFSKGAWIDRILAEHPGKGEALIAFGDGVAEITETARVGGLAVAVASDESGDGRLDAGKRALLASRGAHAVVAHYGDGETLMRALLGEGAAP